MRSTVIQNREGQGRAKPSETRIPKERKKNNSRALQSFEEIWFARFDSTSVFEGDISRHVNGKMRIACLVHIYTEVSLFARPFVV